MTIQINFRVEIRRWSVTSCHTQNRGGILWIYRFLLRRSTPSKYRSIVRVLYTRGLNHSSPRFCASLYKSSTRMRQNKVAERNSSAQNPIYSNGLQIYQQCFWFTFCSWPWMSDPKISSCENRTSVRWKLADYPPMWIVDGLVICITCLESLHIERCRFRLRNSGNLPSGESFSISG